MSVHPRKALVLAAGLGTRLRPLTHLLPKPLMPVWNVPLIEQIVRRLEAWGVEEIAVNTHWLPGPLHTWAATRTGTARLYFSHESEILGTGGALRPLRAFLADGPFWLVNADIVADLPAEPLTDAFAASGNFAAAWVTDRKGPRTVEADRKGRITCFASPTPGVAGTATFCGWQLLSPEILDDLPTDKPFCSIVAAYEQAMTRGRFAHAVTIPASYWDDAGTPEAYRRVHQETRAAARKNQPGGCYYQPAADRAPQATAFFCAPPGLTLPEGLKARRTILFGDALRVDPGASFDGAIVCGGRLAQPCRDLIAVPAAAVGIPTLPAVLDALGWPADETAAQDLGRRGSNRAFFRLLHRDAAAICIVYDPVRAENTRYAGHTRLLRDAGVPVPGLLADLPEATTVVLEDLGDDSLERRMAAAGADPEALYTPVVQALARMHTAGLDAAQTAQIPLEPAFDAALYAWEHRLFEEHLVCGRHGYDALPEAVATELAAIAGRLLAAKPALVHRDFQSSNILFRRGKPVFIDYQGMRVGAAAYDLASLLCDPYVILSHACRKQLLLVYAKANPGDRSALALFAEAAAQRLVQALGAYGRLSAAGHGGFVRHIPRAAETLAWAADAAKCPALAELARTLHSQEQLRATLP